MPLARGFSTRRAISIPGPALSRSGTWPPRSHLGIRSISSLSLKQRELLIDRLMGKGAQVKNPHIYQSDLEEERKLSDSKNPRKIILFSEPKEDQLRMIDTLANRVLWRSPDGYLRLCHKLFRAPRPRNSNEVTRLRLTLLSLISQQRDSLT